MVVALAVAFMLFKANETAQASSGLSTLLRTPNWKEHCEDYDMLKMRSGKTCTQWAGLKFCEHLMRGKHFEASGLKIGDFCPVACGYCQPA